MIHAAERFEERVRCWWRRAPAWLRLAILVQALLGPAALFWGVHFWPNDPRESEGPPSQASPGAPAEAQHPPLGQGEAEPERRPVVLLFEGLSVASDWSRAAELLLEHGVLDEREPVAAEPGESLCNIYVRELDLPGCSPEVVRLGRRLNTHLSEKLEVGARVRLPDLPLSRHTWGRTFDLSLPGGRLRLEDFIKRRTDQKDNQVAETRRRGDLVVVELSGAQTETKELSTEEVRALSDLWADLRSVDLLLAGGPPAPADVPLFSTATELSTFYEVCSRQKEVPAAGHHSESFGVAKIPPCTRNLSSSDRPLIVLVDQPVFPHHDLGKAVLNPWTCPDTEAGIDKEKLCDKAPAEGEAQACPPTEFSRNRHHGTHLAGIMVGLEAPGSIAGMAPDVELYSHNWTPLGIEKPDSDSLLRLLALIRTAVIDGKPPFEDRPLNWVFASAFPVNSFLTPAERENNSLEEDQRRRFAGAKEIINYQLLWITAVGQSDQGSPKRTINASSIRFPMNLGDYDNVVVVTGCEECLSAEPRIWSKADRGDAGVVHVAAPGSGPIPSTASNVYYAATSGTSQAAAYVGGLAAAMTRCSPDTYRKARKMKLRLQVTADPIYTDPEALHLVSTGVVNPRKAMCDPNVHWLTLTSAVHKPQAEPIAGCGYRLKELVWCKESLKLYPPGMGPSTGGFDTELLIAEAEPVRKILRLMKLAAKFLDEHEQWMIYRKGTPQHRNYDLHLRSEALVEKVHPFILPRDFLVARAIFEDDSVADLKLSDIDDLLLRNTVPYDPRKTCGPG